MNNISLWALFILVALIIIGFVGKIYLELYKLFKNTKGRKRNDKISKK